MLFVPSTIGTPCSVLIGVKPETAGRPLPRETRSTSPQGDPVERPQCGKLARFPRGSWRLAVSTDRSVATRPVMMIQYAAPVTDPMNEPLWLRPSPAPRLTGEERFRGLDATVSDFWRWAFSDLRDNTTRAVLAEFLVAKAVDDQRQVRIGWDNYDVQDPLGPKIEVKCSAFLQSWVQKRHSHLVFGRLVGREFDFDRNEYSFDVRVRADVFVFAIQNQREPASYDMLDLAHWEFWIVSGDVVRASGVKSVGIAWVRNRSTGPHRYDHLAAAIRAAAPPPPTT